MYNSFTLIGETHGVRENVEILKRLVSLLSKKGKVTLGFEWPHELTLEINAYIVGAADLRWNKWNFIVDRDGRISKEHVAFLGWIKKRNLQSPKDRQIEIICFDAKAKTWNGRDRKMAKLFLSQIKTSTVSMIVIMGNLHARRTPFLLDGKKYIPMGSYLPKQKATAIKLEYLKGSFFNGMLKKFSPVKDVGASLEFLLEKAKKIGYDRILLIKNAHPITPLR